MSIQIPNLHISTNGTVNGKNVIVVIPSRRDSRHSGGFKVVLINVHFDPLNQDYPTGNVKIEIDLTDSIPRQGKITVMATSIEQINSFGQVTPTVFITGKCTVEPKKNETTGCRFWMMIANNYKDKDKIKSPDIIGFVVFNRMGVRVAYGTGPVCSGSIKIAPVND